MDLDRRKGLQVQGRKADADRPQQIGIVAERQVRIQAVDDVDFGHARLVTLLDPLQGLFRAHRVGAGHALLQPRERAERAARFADVRRIEMQVAVVVGDVAVQPLAGHVGNLADGEQVGVRGEQHAVVEAEPHAGFHLVGNFAKLWIDVHS